MLFKLSTVYIYYINKLHKQILFQLFQSFLHILVNHKFFSRKFVVFRETCRPCERPIALLDKGQCNFVGVHRALFAQ